MTLEQVIAVARQMSPDERAEIIAAIDPAADEFVMTDGLRADLDRRWADYLANPDDVVTLDEFKAWLAAE